MLSQNRRTSIHCRTSRKISWTTLCLVLGGIIVGATSSHAQSTSDQAQSNAAGARASSETASQVSGQTVNVDSAESTAASVEGTSANASDAAAKDAAQNPIAHVISVPFQNNTFFKVGQYQRAENALIIEPVIPVRLSENWILITRTITPLIYVPRVTPSQGETFGLGNLNPQFYLSPAHPGSIIWGAGPQLWLPTATDKALGVNKWGGGPAMVVLTKQGHWLFGALVNNVWAGTGGRHLNEMTLNPFVFYNLPRGWYVMSSPIMTADWLANHDNRWTVPVGGGFGRVFKISRQLVNARAQFWNDVKSPTGGQSWTMQTQIQLLFPRK